MGITILKNNAPWGPFNRAQIEDGLARGDYTVKYLAHAPGLKEWLPLGEVLDYVERASSLSMPSLPPVPGPRELPPVPEQPAFVPGSAPLPPTRPPILPATIKPPPPETAIAGTEMPEIRHDVKSEPKAVVLTPASFFLRGFAFVIDCVILFLPVLIVYLLGALAIEIPAAWHHIPHEARMEEWDHLKDSMGRLFWIVLVAFGWFYVAGLECSRAQATIGKRWLGIKVVDEHGDRISFLRATGRYAAKYLSALPCLLGFVMALFSSRGLALHDRLADTRVVKE